MHDDLVSAGRLQVPGRPQHGFATDLPTTVLMWLQLKLLKRDMALPLGSAYAGHDAQSRAPSAACEAEEDRTEVQCTDQRKAREFDRLSDEYISVVQRNRAAGWVWGPHGNIMITIGAAQLGSCSDWQLDIYRALCALPNIHCWQICMIRTVWHKAVVVYPKDAFWWRASGIVFDPWFLGGPYAYTVGQWFAWCGLSWLGQCCK